MKRRKAIKISFRLLGSSLAAPLLLEAMQGCNSQSTSGWQPAVFSEPQNELVKAIADQIIPRTDTPGATDVLVHEFIDLLLKDVFPEEDVRSFLSGLDQFQKDCKTMTGNSFLDCDTEQKTAYLTKVVSEAESHTGGDASFFSIFKELTLIAYFSTEEGLKQNLHYVPIPGKYEGCAPKEASEKIMAGDHI